jgi:hypothetical protein
MISIITKGELPSEYRYRKTCEKCSTLFEFLQSDTRHVESRDQRDSGLREIVCPLTGCGATALVTQRDRVKTPTSITLTRPPLTFPERARGPFLGESNITYGDR